MRVKLFGDAHHAAVFRVLHQAQPLDLDGFLHLGAGDRASKDLMLVARVLSVRGIAFRFGSHFSLCLLCCWRLRSSRQFLRAQKRFYPREIFFRFAKALERFGLPGGQLKTQPENLFGELFLPRVELVYAGFTDFFDAPRHDQKPPARVTNFVGIGSLCAASPMASLAVASSTPAISNMMRPGFTTATHFSGAPLPLPMRVSAGFLVNGLSGKIRIHNFSPRLMNRVIATRDASIFRSVINSHSLAFKPYSPNAKSPPRQALPLRRPRICFRYFTFFGINIAVFSLP